MTGISTGVGSAKLEIPQWREFINNLIICNKLSLEFEFFESCYLRLN